MPMPHLLDIQTRAFQSLLQPDGRTAPRRRRIGTGLQGPVPDPGRERQLLLEFVKYALGEAKYTVEECIERDMTLLGAAQGDPAAGRHGRGRRGHQDQAPKNIIEKEVYLGELPILTPLGTFVINGAERVIVSQLHRSPGVVFEESIHPNGQRLFSARIIPFRGSWSSSRSIFTT